MEGSVPADKPVAPVQIYWGDKDTVVPPIQGATYQKQKCAMGGNVQRIPLPGLSKGNTKFMLYYDQSGLQASVALNRRTTYVGSVANDAVGGYPTLRYIQGSALVSAQIGYERQSGYLKGLSVRFEGNNLNKPVYRQLKADGVTVDSEIKTGAAYALRVGYKF